MDRADGGGVGEAGTHQFVAKAQVKACVLCSGGGGVLVSVSVDGTSEDDLRRTGVWGFGGGDLDID